MDGFPSRDVNFMAEGRRKPQIMSVMSSRMEITSDKHSDKNKEIAMEDFKLVPQHPTDEETARMLIVDRLTEKKPKVTPGKNRAGGAWVLSVDGLNAMGPSLDPSST